MREQAERAIDRKDASAAFWRGVLADKTGRAEIWGLLQSAGTFNHHFACGPNGFPQAEATWLHLGEKSFGQRLWQMLLRVDLDGVHEMHTEHDPEWQKQKRRVRK